MILAFSQVEEGVVTEQNTITWFPVPGSFLDSTLPTSQLSEP